MAGEVVCDGTSDRDRARDPGRRHAGAGQPDEDTRGGFDRGGWALAGNDEVMARVMGEGMARPGAMVVGRRTYEDFAAFWPHQTNSPYTDALNKTQKYVASRWPGTPAVSR